MRIARSTITGQFAAIKLIKKPADDVKVRSYISLRVALEADSRLYRNLYEKLRIEKLSFSSWSNIPTSCDYSTSTRLLIIRTSLS